MAGIRPHFKVGRTLRQVLLVLSVCLCVLSAYAAHQLGDLAPRGTPDGQLNAGDLVIMQKLSVGELAPTADELIIGDVAPLSGPDGVINAADLLILTRALLGEITLGTVDIIPPAPTLNPILVNPTNLNPYTISGTVEPDATVDIYVNNILAGATTALSDGSFSTDVVLKLGSNVIFVTTSDGAILSLQSNSVNVNFQLADGGDLSGGLGGFVLAENTSYRVTGNVSVLSGQTLTIGKGAQLLFAQDKILTVRGGLIVNGTVDFPVVFSSLRPPYRSAFWGWGGIRIDTTDDVSINYATVEWANPPGLGAFYITECGLVCEIKNSIIKDNSEGIRILGASPIIGPGNVITQNLQSGIKVIESNFAPTLPVITGNSIYSNGVVGSLVNIETTSFDSPYDTKINATNNWWGTSNENEIRLHILDNSLERIQSGGFGFSTRATIDWSGYRLSENGASDASVSLSGVITSGLISSGLYKVIGDIYIPAGGTLIIEAGAVLEFVNGSGIGGDGVLLIQGVPNNPVIMRSLLLEVAGDKWRGIDLNASASGSNIDGLLLQDVNPLLDGGAITVSGATNVTVQNTTITNSTKDGIRYSAGATGSVINNTITGASTAISVVKSSPDIINNNIINNGNGIKVNGASPLIQGNFIAENTGEGITINNNDFPPVITNPVIMDNIIINNIGNGIRINGTGSDATNPQPVITGNDIFGNGTYQLFVLGYGTTSTLAINATGNWWGVPSPVFGVEVNVFSFNTPVSAVDFSARLANPTGLFVSQKTVLNPAFSPDANGVKDTFTINATLSGVADSWTVSIKDSVSVIRTFPPGTGDTISIVWDGLSDGLVLQGDGTYTITIDAVLAGSSFIPQNNAVQAILDNTPPVATIGNPLDGSMQQSVLSIPITGGASDANFESYLVNYSPDISPGSLVTLKTSTSNSIQSGQLANWIVGSNDGSVTPPNNGSYTFNLTVTDAAGNISIDSVQFELENMYIGNVSHSSFSFNPLKGEAMSINFDASGPGTVVMNILTEKNQQLVYTGSVNFTSDGTQTILWDGTDNSGNYVADAAYTYTLSSNNAKQITFYDPPYVLKNSNNLGASTAVNFDVSKNEFWKNTMKYITRSAPRKISMCVSPNAPFFDCDPTEATYIVPIDEEPIEGDSNVPDTIYWDGRDQFGAPIGSGSYYFVLTPAVDLPVNTITVNGTTPSILGEGVAPSIEVKSNPYIIRHSYDEFSQMKFQINQDSFVTVKLLPPGIYDPSNPSATVLLPTTSLNAESSPDVPQIHTVEWKGYDEAIPDPQTNNLLVEQEGMYTFTIEATGVDTGITTLYRGALTLYR